MKKVGVLVNGPGEMLGWARPVCRDLGRRGYKIDLIILPCQFSSGNEKEIAESIHSDQVSGPSGVISTFSSFFGEKVDAVLQLGGDLMFGRVLSFLSRAPLVSYSYGYKKGMERCSAVLTAYDVMKKMIKRPGVDPVVVGDLVLDSISFDEAEDPWSADGTGKVLFLPGSRSYMLNETRIFFRRFLEHAQKKAGDLQIKTLLPFFATSEQLQLWQKAGLSPYQGNSGDFIRGADMVIAPPGTNNLEMMHCGIPTIIVLPFSFLRNVPLSGLKSLVEKIPYAGLSLKEFMLRKADPGTGFMGWPNRLAEKEIQIEIRGDVTPEMVAEEALGVLQDKQLLGKMGKELLQTSAGSKKDPSRNVCDVVERLI